MLSLFTSLTLLPRKLIIFSLFTETIHKIGEFIMTRRQYFTAGFKDGIPICLGYIAVSFTFGIMAKKVGISFALGDGTDAAGYQLKILSDVLRTFAED